MTTTALVSTILLTLGAACTTAPFDDGTRTGCVPGETQACTGTGACAGSQVCLDDGTWGACDCGEVDGGAGGDGGASGDGGSAGTDGGGDGGTDGGGDGGSDGGSDGGAAPTTLDASEITFLDNPPDLASWPETTQITLVEFGDHVHVEFSKQDGEGRWPDIVPPGWDGPLQYTLGLAEYIDGQWYGSAAIQFWYGLYESGGNVALDNQIAVNWYYDSRWGALEGRQPATGEVVGLFVVAGNVRGVTDGSQSPVMERSNVVLVPFPDVHGAIHTW